MYTSTLTVGVALNDTATIIILLLTSAIFLAYE